MFWVFRDDKFPCRFLITKIWVIFWPDTDSFYFEILILRYFKWEALQLAHHFMNWSMQQKL